MALLNGDHSTNVSTVIKELANLTKPGNELKLNANELSTSLNVLVRLVKYNAEGNNSIVNTSVDQQNIVQIASNLLEVENSDTWLLLQEVLFVDFFIERSSFECRSTKARASKITLTNHKRHRQSSEPIKLTSKYKHAAGTKRWKTCVSELRLVLVLLLIG